jgi:hypothetical protein
MFYIQRALLWAEKVVITCTTDSAKMLHNIILHYFITLA